MRWPPISGSLSISNSKMKETQRIITYLSTKSFYRNQHSRTLDWIYCAALPTKGRPHHSSVGLQVQVRVKCSEIHSANEDTPGARIAWFPELVSSSAKIRFCSSMKAATSIISRLATASCMLSRSSSKPRCRSMRDSLFSVLSQFLEQLFFSSLHRE